MRLVSSNLANCHASVQKLLIRQVLTKLMVWSWRFSRRQCVMNNVHSTMTRPSRLPLSQVWGVINKPTTVELCISPVYRRLAVAKFSKSTVWKLLTWPWPRPFHGRFSTGGVGLAMVSQCTKFGSLYIYIYRFTRYEAMNVGAKCM